MRPLCEPYMPCAVGRSDPRVPRERGKVVLDEIINDWDDGCHVQHDIDISLEPELLAVVVHSIGILWLACTICGGELDDISVVEGPPQTVQTHPILPNCKLFGFVQGSVGPVQGDFGCLQRQQIRTCVVDVDELHLQCIKIINTNIIISQQYIEYIYIYV